MSVPQKRAVLIVLDGAGIGELPDAPNYGDAGSNTLGNTAIAVDGLKLPHLAALGLGNIAPIRGVQPSPAPRASFGRMAEASKGKDSTTGHWELAGLITNKPFPTFPDGFPAPMMEQFKIATKCPGFLGNIAASGTAIIESLGAKHIETGFPIVYTSADSVFQIAAHEEIIPITRLYEICRIAREIVCKGEYEVGRVIARPFIGSPGNFRRTANRRDFSVEPHGRTLLDELAEAGLPVSTIGKVDELFAGRGIGSKVHTANNAEGIKAIITQITAQPHGLIFANLVDFDTLYGHRNDPGGFARALAQFDESLPRIEDALSPHDLLIITADHGNDPTARSTDHSREYVPLICLVKSQRVGKNLGTRPTYADAGKTIADYFKVRNSLAGSSFLTDL